MVTIFTTSVATGQLCTGSLGDPVVNFNFGAGNNPGSPIRPGVVTYQYTTNACPDDGFYTLVNSSSNCFSSTWHNLSTDHTAQGNGGYMMLVNASFAPGIFYTDTVKGLCGGTTYEFAAWAVNMLKSSSCQGIGVTPNLLFTIETTAGQMLGTYATGNIPSSNSPEWKQYGLFFSTPAGVSDVVLRIANSNPGGCGNDVAIDDITFRPCGPQISAVIAGTNATIRHMCEGSTDTTILFAQVSPGFANAVFQWQQSTSNGQLWTDIAGAEQLQYRRPPSTIGRYLYRMVVAEAGNMGVAVCRIASNQVVVDVHVMPGKTVGSNSPLCEGSQIQLNASTGSMFSWTGPNGFTATGANPTLPATPAATGTYEVMASDSFGCAQSNTTQVIVHPKPIASINQPVTVCEGNPITLQASGGTQYRWLVAPDTTTLGRDSIVTLLLPAASNPYAVVAIVGNGFGCFDSSVVAVSVLGKSTVNAGPDRFIFEGDSTRLLGSADTGLAVQWIPALYLSNAAVLQPMAAPPADIAYTIQTISVNGCGTARDTMQVIVYKKISLPNAFSPNNDGINDVWQIPALASYDGCKVMIFDRYGRQVFQSTGYNQPWNGSIKNQPLPAGVYYYVIDLNIANRKLQGSVTIIR